MAECGSQDAVEPQAHSDLVVSKKNVFRFMDLPAELRLRIYQFYSPQHFVDIDRGNWRSPDYGEHGKSYFRRSIFQVSRRVRYEAICEALHTKLVIVRKIDALRRFQHRYCKATAIHVDLPNELRVLSLYVNNDQEAMDAQAFLSSCKRVKNLQVSFRAAVSPNVKAALIVQFKLQQAIAILWSVETWQST